MYIRKTIDEFQILCNYGYGWECVTTEETYKKALITLKEYRENDPNYMYRIKKVRVKKEV